MLKPKLLTTLKTYNREQLIKDVVAGIIVAIIALPLSIALATASGVAPEKGLHTAIVAGFIISFLGGSRVQIGGPTGAFMVIIFGIIAEFGIDGLITATFLGGIIMILFGLFKVGNVIKYIPYTITTGFTAGIGVVIFTAQIKEFFGLTFNETPGEFIEKWKVYLEYFNTVNLTTTMIGALTLVILVLWPKVTKKIPGAFVALLITSLVVLLLDLPVMTIGERFGRLSGTLPLPSMPELSISYIKPLIAPAMSIAILGSIESLLSAVVSDGMIDGKHRSNMELIAQGLGNIGSSLIGGIPATGAIARTAANVENGGRTPVAGMVHSITLLVILLVFMPLISYVPLTSLAAILMIVAYNMSELHVFKHLFRFQKGDAMVLLLTFGLTVFIDLIVAIEFGMVLAAVIFMKRIIESSEIKSSNLLDYSEEETEYTEGLRKIHMKSHEYVQIYHINGPFFFGTATKFIDAIHELHLATKYLIMDMTHVSFVDSTATNSLKMLASRAKHLSIQIIIVNTQPSVKKELERQLFFGGDGKLIRLSEKNITELLEELA